MAENLVFDGQNSFLGGQDASKSPQLIPKDSYSAGINTNVSKGAITPRWSWGKKKLIFPDEVLPISGNRFVPYSEIFHSGRFQALIPYSIGVNYYLIIVIAGVIFLVNRNTFEVTIIPIQDGSSLNETAPRLNWSNAGRFLVIFDWPNFPVILEGITAKRADPTLFEVPISVMGTYNQNRLFIANAGNEFTGGDPTGNLATLDAPVTFEEVEAPAGLYLGQIFQLPTADINERITAMGFLQLTDTSTGIGPLIIGTRRAIYSFNTQTPRASWDAGNFGSLFAQVGIAGPRSFVNVNSDIFFLSPDGYVRTASMSRDEQKKWSRVPLSREVQNWLKYWDKSLIPYGVLGYFNNKIFISANPYRTNAQSTNRIPIHDVAYGGFVVIGLDNLATLRQGGNPAWDGLYTGVRPMDIVTCDDRCFVMSKDADFSNELYEIDPSITYDTSEGKIRYVRSIIYTRELDCESDFQNKGVHSLDLNLSNIEGDFSINTEFRPTHTSRFVEWRKFNHVAPWRVCDVPDECDINGLEPHNLRDLTLGSPNEGETCDPVNQSLYNVFRRLQLKFTIEGKYWELEAFRLKAISLKQAEIDNSCEPQKVVKLCKECNTSDWDYGAFESCQTPQT